MILTVTLNPSVDVNYQLDDFAINESNRVETVSKTAGGKGLNVASILKQLGHEVAATGLLGGELGDFIRKRVTEKGIRDNFMSITGETRNCIAIIHNGKQTELLEAGPEISYEESNDFLGNFLTSVSGKSIVTISGSLPRGLTAKFYKSLILTSLLDDIPVLLDTKGSILKEIITSVVKPYMIKPNEAEIADVMGTPIKTEADIRAALDGPMFAYIPWIIVTLGAAGAVVKHRGSYYRVHTPEIEAVNPVGSGDAVVAGFAAAKERGLKSEERIKFALAMGVLNALESKTGHIDPSKIDWCMENTRVEPFA